MLGPEGAPIQRRYVCSKDEKELDDEEIIRGYEIEKGKFVTVTDDELEAIAPRKSREIDLRLFVSLAQIDPMLFDRGYFLTPAGGSNKAYRLLAAIMEESGKAGIATFVMRAKEYLVAIIAEKGILRAETLRFIDEVRSPDAVGLPDVPKSKPAVVSKFEKLISTKSGKLEPSKMTDPYAERVQNLVAKKQKQHSDVVKLEKQKQEPEQGGEVIDILEALRRSMAAPKRKPARKAPARKRGSTKKRA